MRRFVTFLALPTLLGAVAIAAAGIWRRNPRIGTAFVNAVVNPVLLRRGLAGVGGSEIGTLEHVGRKSGIRRMTLVHPEPTPTGFRVLVPLGGRSEWARNVIAAGHCRVQLHDQVFDLDEPAMIDAGEARDLPWPLRRVFRALGFQYLTMRTFALRSGGLGLANERDLEGRARPDGEEMRVQREEALSAR